MSTAQLAIRRACEDPEVRSKANLARLLGPCAPSGRLSPAMVQQWADGRRPIPPQYCPAIKRITFGRVQLWDLRPLDWHVIWPDQVDAEGAPPVPRAENDPEVRAQA